MQMTVLCVKFYLANCESMVQERWLEETWHLNVSFEQQKPSIYLFFKSIPIPGVKERLYNIFLIFFLLTSSYNYALCVVALNRHNCNQRVPF